MNDFVFSKCVAAIKEVSRYPTNGGYLVLRLGSLQNSSSSKIKKLSFLLNVIKTGRKNGDRRRQPVERRFLFNIHLGFTID